MSYSAPLVDPSIEAAYRRAIDRRPENVTFQRLSGLAPNVTTVSATVVCMVHKVAPDDANERVEGHVRIGAVAQSGVEIIAMMADLAGQGFPLPVAETDRVILSSTGAKLTVNNVDSHTRALAGAVVVKAAGIE